MAWRAVRFGLLGCSLSLVAHVASAQAPATVPTSTRVTSTAPATASPSAPAPPAASAPNSVEKARQGVVVIERQGKLLALGTVLEGDGRVLTALSALGAGYALSARYHDGVVVPLKLVHQDRNWDLALLAPVASKDVPLRKAGVRAARTPSFTGLQTFAAQGNTVTTQPSSLQISPGLASNGADALPLNGAYDLSNKTSQLGAAIVNTAGEVVALVAAACPAPSSARCVPTRYGVPVPALKQFLQRAPSEATWLGVEAAADLAKGVQGLRVVAVTPGGPAAVAGLRPGKDSASADLIVAVDGTPVTSPAELNEAVRSRSLGDTVEVLVFGMGRYRHVLLKPTPAPQLVAPPYTAPKPGKPRTPNPYR